MWQPWQYSSKEDLAHYVIPDITSQLKLTLPGLSSTQANTLEGRKKLLVGIYNWLCQREIEYEYEPPSNNDHQQIIRTPQAILQDNKKGTCLDLALLFAGLCLEFRLLPLVVIQEEHSFVVVSLQQNRAQLEMFMSNNKLVGGLVTDVTLLNNPRDFVAIECTGFARSLGGFTEALPEFVSRWDGLLSFRDAVTVGKQRLAQGMEYAVNVAYWQKEEGYQPYAMEAESSTQQGSTNIQVGDIQGGFSGNIAGRDIRQLFYGNIILENIKPRKFPLQRPLRVKEFTNRTDEINENIQQIKPGETITLCGMGGIGKTALASEIIWQLAPENKPPLLFPDGIITHRFYDFPEVDLAFEHIIRSLGGKVVNPIALTAQRMLAGKKLLLFLDGTERADNLNRLQQITNHCGVIITSRKLSDSLNGQYQHLSPLPHAEALKFLQSFVKPKKSHETDCLSDICELLDGLPLAIHLAGCYLARTKENLDEFLGWLKTKPLSALNHGESQTKSVEILLKRTMDPLSEMAKQILALTSYLALAPFKGEWLNQIFETDFRHLRHPLNELMDFGLLLRMEEQQYQLSHTLTHTYIKEQLLPYNKFFIEKLYSVFLHEIQGTYNDSTINFTLLEHLRSINNMAQKLNHPLKDNIGVLLYEHIVSKAMYYFSTGNIEKTLHNLNEARVLMQYKLDELVFNQVIQEIINLEVLGFVFVEQDKVYRELLKHFKI